jgi:AAA+ superfamily predicted ATPase
MSNYGGKLTSIAQAQGSLANAAAIAYAPGARVTFANRGPAAIGTVQNVASSGDLIVLWDGGQLEAIAEATVRIYIRPTNIQAPATVQVGGATVAYPFVAREVDEAPAAPEPKQELKKGKVSFDTVILPDEKKEQIIDAISQEDHHNLIFKEWGFEEVFEKGTAISLLFYGEPGTGKTLMAQAIADKYGKELEFVAAAEIETPEPGGAERNLKEYFAKSQESGSVLLFDECDSLITDRSRVGMILAAQINALLTELERHKGIVIFTTNRLGALDPAFERRLSLKLEFEMPGIDDRAKIWARMFPKKCPLDKDVNFLELAEAPIAGGHIKNVVLKAARKAAHAKRKNINQETLMVSLEQEVDSIANYSKALKEYNPFYGTPVKGGQGGAMGVDRGVGVDLKRVKGKVMVAKGGKQ